MKIIFNLKRILVNYMKVFYFLLQILIMIIFQKIKCYGINHDFINNIDLIDNHINKNSLSYLNDDSLIEEKADEELTL